MRKVQETRRRLKKVEEGSRKLRKAERRLRKVEEGWRLLLDPQFHTVSWGSWGPSQVPGPLGSAPIRFEEVRGCWSEFEKV